MKILLRTLRASFFFYDEDTVPLRGFLEFRQPRQRLEKPTRITKGQILDFNAITERIYTRVRGGRGEGGGI